MSLKEYFKKLFQENPEIEEPEPETPMKKYDVVYVFKGGESEELKYSIRSVVKNFPYNRIVVYSGKPKGLNPDLYVPYSQHGTGKISRVVHTMEAIAINDELTEDIWLFNDDFFIMQPYKEDSLPLCNGTIYDVVNRIEKSRLGHASKYTDILKITADYLMKNGKSIISYASHTPLLMNREKMKEIFRVFPNEMSFRSAYGNYWEIGGRIGPDVKIIHMDEEPNREAPFLSTNDRSFSMGRVGEYIREQFPEPSQYEK